MSKKNKDILKDGNSLETQFWSDDVEIDYDSPFTKFINKLWKEKDKNNSNFPTKKDKEKLDKEMKEYFTK